VDVVASFFQNFFQQIRSVKEEPPYLNIEPEDLRIEMVDNAAVVTFHLNGDEALGRRTLVFGRDDTEGTWKIVHLHASHQKEPGPGSEREFSEDDADLSDTIMNIIQNLATAWVRLDPEEYLSHFSDDLIFYFQGAKFSWGEFEKIIRETMSELQESAFEVGHPEVKVLGPDAAVITFQVEERMLDKKETQHISPEC